MRLRVCHLRHPIGLVWLSFDDDFFFLTTVQHCDSGSMTVCYIYVWSWFMFWFHRFFPLGVEDSVKVRVANDSPSHNNKLWYCWITFIQMCHVAIEPSAKYVFLSSQVSWPRLFAFFLFTGRRCFSMWESHGQTSLRFKGLKTTFSCMCFRGSGFFNAFRCMNVLELTSTQHKSIADCDRPTPKVKW